MKKLLSCVLAFSAFAANATTLSPIQLLNPTGSTAGQAIVSTGASTAPAWTTIPKTGSPLSQFSATTSAQLAGVISDETGTGFVVFGTSPTILQPNIVGITNGANANAGSVGEVATPTNLTGVSLTTGTAVNVSSASLTAGDWDVSCTGIVTPAGSTLIGTFNVGINTVTGTMPGSASGAQTSLSATTSAGNLEAVPTPIVQKNVTTTTPVYCVMQSTFSTSTATGAGVMHTRRIR